ncbi:type II toxin-antitoxin system RelE/ParE family toxin [candidate division KSB1 bacterium]|nr:type II toxin-antitoxin system RelE/ParE family toxin [candidate division KSB1 bacterium]
MSKYKLTVEADKDLDNIWEYTNSQWGRNQARKYLRHVGCKKVDDFRLIKN